MNYLNDINMKFETNKQNLNTKNIRNRFDTTENQRS